MPFHYTVVTSGYVFNELTIYATISMSTAIAGILRLTSSERFIESFIIFQSSLISVDIAGGFNENLAS